MIPRNRLRGIATAAAGLVLAGGVAHAQELTVSPREFAHLRSQVDLMAEMITRQQHEIEALKAERDQVLASIRAGTAPPPIPYAGLAGLEVEQIRAGQRGDAPTGPVGQKPADAPDQRVREALSAVPQQVNVLTPKGVLIVDPQVEYDRTSSDRLVFRGVEIVPGINLGLVDANRATRDLVVATAAVRYGLTERLEVEARVPYAWRHDQVVTVAAQANNFTQLQSLYGRGIGDVELNARYQLNHGQNGLPYLVATARLKPPTGKGPYDVSYDSGGVATELATGSGFWGAEGGVTMLYPTDPAIIFGSLTYLHNFSRDVDKTFGEGGGALHVARVDPGASIGAAIGFGMSLNPRFSFSLGYAHNYVFPTTSVEGSPGATPLKAKSQALEVGRMLLGTAFRLTDRLTINSSFEFGMTSDAPDLQFILRLPYRF